MGIQDKENYAKKPEPLMSVKELAEFLNVKESWVYAQIREAKRTGFPVIKVRKYRRFIRQDVMDWLANNTT
jgi:excisionase family DNA binding protein